MDATTGLLTPYGQYHTAPMPMLVHRGRIWRALEDATASTLWGIRYNPLIVSAPSSSHTSASMVPFSTIVSKLPSAN